MLMLQRFKKEYETAQIPEIQEWNEFRLVPLSVRLSQFGAPTRYIPGNKSRPTGLIDCLRAKADSYRLQPRAILVSAIPITPTIISYLVREGYGVGY